MSDEEAHNRSSVMNEVKHVIDNVLGKFQVRKSPTDKKQDTANQPNTNQVKNEKECESKDKPTPRSTSTPKRYPSRSLSSGKPRHHGHRHKGKHHGDIADNTNGNNDIDETKVNGNQDEKEAETHQDTQRHIINTPSLDIAFANKLHQRRQHEAKEQNSYHLQRTSNNIDNNNTNTNNNTNITPRPYRSSSTPAGTARSINTTTSHYTTPRYSVSPRSASVRSQHSSANSNAQILHRAAIVSSVRYFTAKRAASIAHTIGLMDDEPYVHHHHGEGSSRHGRLSSSSASSSVSQSYNHHIAARYSIRPPSGQLTQAQIFALERMAQNDARRSENLERAALLQEQRNEYLQQMSEQKSHKAQSYLQELLREQKERIAALRAWRKEHTSEILSRHESLEEERQQHYERLIASNAAPLDAFQLMYAKQLYQTPQLRASSPVAPQRLTSGGSSSSAHPPLLRDRSENTTTTTTNNINNNGENEEEHHNNKVHIYRTKTPGRKHKTHQIDNGHTNNTEKDNNNVNHVQNEEDDEDAEAFLSKHIEKRATNEVNKQKLDGNNKNNNNTINHGHSSANTQKEHPHQQRNGNKIECGNENDEHADELQNQHVRHHTHDSNTMNSHRKVNGSTPLRRRRHHSRNVSKTPIRAWH